MDFGKWVSFSLVIIFIYIIYLLNDIEIKQYLFFYLIFLIIFMYGFFELIFITIL